MGSLGRQGSRTIDDDLHWGHEIVDISGCRVIV